ncbi:phage tailspike protein [Enterobacter roggenkampii]|uniref:phage tailspike protein n=1 Tax=Enterobacter roggenkampii TaxID=1812935 RepID=UPI002E73E6D6|nr:hypothetical protein [Enterobacter roggenkampii]
MSDITPNVVVSMPSQLFTLARSFKAVANGSIYIGQIDADPTIPSNQIQVYLENEDGDHIPVPQPIVINAGGYPVYNGQISKFVTIQGHSMAVYDAYGVQQFYFPNVLKYDPDQLKALLASSQGATLVGYQYKGASNATIRKVSDVLDERVSIWDFHCDSSGNVIQPGPTVDSRVYIQNAIDYLSAHGGGTLVVPEGVTWYLNSFNAGPISGHSGVLQLKSNVNIQLDGTIKLTTFFAAKSFQVFVGFDNADPSLSGDLNNCSIFGVGTIDLGNNAMASGGNLRSAISMGRSYNCSVYGIKIVNGDMTWAITVGWNGYGRNSVIHGVTFDNLIQSNNNQDHSTVYVGCPYSGVENCKFNSTNARAKIIACTVELHQHDTWYRNSTINGYVRGCYVVMHSAEAGGAGAYLYNAEVSNIIGTISGQFVILASDKTGSVQGTVNGVVVSGCAISVPDNITNASFIEIAPGAYNLLNDNLINNLTVVGNSFTATSSSSLSAGLNIRANLNGAVFHSNFFDTRYFILINGAAINSVAVNNLIWEESNTLGYSHAGLRTGLNLIDMQANSVNNSRFSIKLPYEDTSMYSVILFRSSCSVTYTAVHVAADFTQNMTNTAVFEGNQQSGANVYTSYPATIAFTSYSTAGAVAFFSTGTSYGWVSSAYPLASGGDNTFYLPPAWTSKTTGQLFGIGYNESGAVRSGNVRLMLSRKV